LPSVEQIVSADNKVLEKSGVHLSNEWLYNWPSNDKYGSEPPYAYWTSTYDSYNNIWCVDYRSNVSSTPKSSSGDLGVRSVITLSKTDLD